MYLCPVCGYNRLRFPPDNYTICPSCGTKFGYSDITKTHAQLRAEWRAHGARWHSGVTPPPEQWDAYQQLANLEQRPMSETTSSTVGHVHWVGQIVDNSDQARFFSQHIHRFTNLNDVIRSQAVRA